MCQADTFSKLPTAGEVLLEADVLVLTVVLAPPLSSASPSLSAL